ncbi:MAG: hypothetical protein K5978_01225 [Campylobacter sp.]|nr:hypothetical protein [Campylobacter sp.]
MISCAIKANFFYKNHKFLPCENKKFLKPCLYQICKSKNIFRFKFDKNKVLNLIKNAKITSLAINKFHYISNLILSQNPKLSNLIKTSNLILPCKTKTANLIKIPNLILPCKTKTANLILFQNTKLANLILFKNSTLSNLIAYPSVKSKQFYKKQKLFYSKFDENKILNLLKSSSTFYAFFYTFKQNFCTLKRNFAPEVAR